MQYAQELREEMADMNMQRAEFFLSGSESEGIVFVMHEVELVCQGRFKPEEFPCGTQELSIKVKVGKNSKGFSRGLLN